MARDLWTYIATWQGERLRTLALGRPFSIVALSDSAVTIRLGRSGHSRRIRREELEGAYRDLLEHGEIGADWIRRKHAPWNSSFVSALLARLPEVQYDLRPIRLVHRGRSPTLFR